MNTIAFAYELESMRSRTWVCRFGPAWLAALVTTGFVALGFWQIRKLSP